MAADVLARRTASFPATERLHAGPRAGRRAGGAVDVDDARFDARVECVDFGLYARKQPRGEAELGVVGAAQRLVEAVDGLDGHDRHEQLVAQQLVVAR